MRDSLEFRRGLPEAGRTPAGCPPARRAGKHDRAWGPERPVYGKIRYMSYQSTSHEFNSKAYMEKVHSLI